MSTRLRQLVAWVALIAFAGVFDLGGLGPGHRADDDSACRQFDGPLVPAGRVEATLVKPSIPATHCPYCHWQRSLSGCTLVPSADVISSIVALDDIPSAPSPALTVSASTRPPARAPPARDL